MESQDRSGSAEALGRLLPLVPQMSALFGAGSGCAQLGPRILPKLPGAGAMASEPSEALPWPWLAGISS